MDITRKGIAVKSIGQLFDELSIVNIRCWYCQEKLMNESLSTEERLDAAIGAQKANARRSALVSAIDKELEEEESNFGKTYK
jgi:hypothetical protein